MKHGLVMLMAIFLLSCGNKSTVDSEPSVKDMKAAIEKAKGTLDTFFENYKTMKNDSATLKFGLKTSDGGVEHIWFKPIEVNGDTIKAECGNEPRDIPGLKLGDVREFKRDQIDDWMIVVGNTCYGGYTLRVLAKKKVKGVPPFEYKDF